METYYREAIKLCSSLLVEKGLTLSFAESATAGRALMEFSLVDIAGQFLNGGVVFFNPDVRDSLLKVNPEVVKLFSPESIEVSRELVKGLSHLIDADIKVGITGITGQRIHDHSEKPIGSIFVYCALGNALLFEESYLFKGSSEEIIMETIAQISIDIYIHLIALELND